MTIAPFARDNRARGAFVPMTRMASVAALEPQLILKLPSDFSTLADARN
jgi:hypothetical protein